jgi:transcriptional antiterminator RfaH
MSTNGVEKDGRAPVGDLDTRAGSESQRLVPGQRWYVAQTLAKREIGALGQLRAQGFHVFLPQLYKTVRHARKMRTVKAAVFPGYLFVALDLQRDRWRSVNGTIGVSRLVMGRDLPAPVPHGVVETFLDHLDENGLCRLDRDLQRGQAVRVIAGPLADAIGRLIDLDGNGRVRVLLEIMGGQVVTNLARSTLEAA